jgi:hypothetical protein
LSPFERQQSLLDGGLMVKIIRYLHTLTAAKQILWCYLIWYLCMLSIYFDSDPALWLNSSGLALLVGYALFLSTGPGSLERFKLRFWESFRLFMCPFLVSSFSALVKGKGFILLFSSQLYDNLLGIAFCMSFLLLVQLCSFCYQNKAFNKFKPVKTRQ